MKKIAVLIAAIFIASLLLVIPFTGCEGEVSFTTASLSEVTMCTGVDSEEKPVGIADSFNTDTPEIYTSAKLSNAPADTELKVEWIYIKGEADVTDYLIDEFTGTTEGSGYPWVSLSRPEDGWPKGDYKVVWYIDGKEKMSLPFKVE